MRPVHRVGLVLTLAVLGATQAAFVMAERASARLLRITSRTGPRMVSVFIEASDPVAYVTRQPDPLTLLVDLRNVDAAGVRPHTINDNRGPVSAVRVEEATAADGTTLARVRVLLSRVVPHRVSSERSVIRIEFDKEGQAQSRASAHAPIRLEGGAAAPAAPDAAPVATQLRSVETTAVDGGLRVTLKGNGRLTPGSIAEAEDPPPRLVLDFSDLTSAVPAVTAVNVEPIERIRVSTHSHQPLITRVVIDLSREAEYRIEPPEANERDLRVFFPAEQTTRAASDQGVRARGQTPNELAVPPDASGTVVLDPMAALRTGAAAQATAILVEEPGGNGTPSAQFPSPSPPVGDAGPPAAGPPADRPAPSAPTGPVAQPTPQATPAPAQATTVQIPGAQGGQQFTGQPITLDFQNADLRAVLRTFAEISGLNIVIDPAVQGTVDVRLTDVPWDQALDIILRANRLGYIVDGTVIRIAPLETLRAEAEERRKLAEAEALSGELQVLTQTLSYSRAANLAQLLTRTVLSQRGQVQVDERTNTLIISDLSDRLQAARDLIATLDRPEPQVEIEARIVQTTRDFARALGVQWGLSGRVSPDLGNTTPLSFPNQGSIGGRTGVLQGSESPRAGALEQTPTAVDLAAPGATSAIGLALGAVNGALNLDVALSALERTGRGRVLSTPRVTTQNNVAAEVTQGVQIPIQTVANNTVTVTFKDAALTLRVTPQITAADTVIMNVSLENASPDFSRQVNLIPPIDTQRANTTVQVSDGETTVIGGIFVSREQATINRTPFLHRIPLLGWLFRRDEVSDESRELLIFITPRIIR